MNKDKELLLQLNQEYEQKNMSKEQVELMKKRIQDAKNEKRANRTSAIKKAVIASAAAAAVFVLLPNTSQDIAYAMSNLPIVGGLVKVVTFRDYKYEDERHNADIKVPELKPEDAAAGTETEQTSPLKKTTEEINQEIREITDRIVTEFEENAKDQEGYQDVIVTSEVLSTGENYFTLKLICYQGAGSGAEWDYYYTIDLTTGERIALADLFADGSDYIAAISEEIKEQMKARMEEDEDQCYWLDNKDVPEWNFQAITDETSFYLNEKNNIVICFNEGDVAPMYMGCVAFEIPDEVVRDMRK